MAHDKLDMAAIAATPEFKTAVAEAAAKAAAEAVAEIAKSAALPAGTNADNSLLAFAQLMAAQIGEVADQGTNRKRVAPEILAKRAAADKRMRELLALALAAGEQPLYRLKTKTQLNERLIEPYRRNADKSVTAVEIVWTGIPNEAMFPINTCAEEIYDAYRESIGAAPRLTSLKGPHGGTVAPDNRAVRLTPGGQLVAINGADKLIVKGEEQSTPFTTAPTDPAFRDNNDPNAPTVRVLGTVAAPARRNPADLGAAMGRAI